MSREDLFTLIPLLVLLVALIFLGISHLQLQDKYEALGMDYPMKDIAAVDVKVYGPALKAVAEIFKQYDVPVEVGAENLTAEMIKPIV
jgi:hypothetical protein